VRRENGLLVHAVSAASRCAHFASQAVVCITLIFSSGTLQENFRKGAPRRPQVLVLLTLAECAARAQPGAAPRCGVSPGCPMYIHSLYITSLTLLPLPWCYNTLSAAPVTVLLPHAAAPS
jgi:hypothetical protein